MAEDYRARLREVGMIASMSLKDNCGDDVVVESTFATIKIELFGDVVTDDIHAVQRRSFPYIEGLYTRRRRHSTSGNITPAEKKPAVAEKKVA